MSLSIAKAIQAHQFKRAVLDLPFTRADERLSGEKGMVTDGEIALQWSPVRVGTLRGRIGSFRAMDWPVRTSHRQLMLTGRVRLLGGQVALCCRIDYESGRLFELPRGMDRKRYTLDYYYDSTIVRNYELQLTSSPVVASPRRLVAHWGPEEDQDLQFYAE